MRSRDRVSAGTESAREPRRGLSPVSSHVARLLALQRTAGNAAVGRMLARDRATTWGGEWNAEPYEEWHNPQQHDAGTALAGEPISEGVDIRLAFTPNANATADKIGLVQSIKAVKDTPQGTEQYRPVSEPVAASAQEQLSVPGGAQKDWAIDRRFPNTNPIYGADDIQDTTGKTLADTTFNNQEPGFSQLFERGVTDKAVVCDTPMRPTPLAANARMEFETTAIALTGPDKDTYYGSVTWGWTTDGNGRLVPIPFVRKSDRNPTASFTESAKIWNASSNRFRPAMRPNPVTTRYEKYIRMSDEPKEKNIQIPIPRDSSD
jgi:hypothetical protein